MELTTMAASSSSYLNLHHCQPARGEWSGSPKLAADLLPYSSSCFGLQKITISPDLRRFGVDTCPKELPEVSLSNSVTESPRNLTFTKTVEGVGLGELGDMMVAMLPDDLAFTVFVPSEEAFGRLLKLRSHDSLSKDRLNETYAVVSRVMGFSAVPRHIPSKVIPLHKEMTFDSVSGFRLHAWKDLDGTLVVNGIRSEIVDIRKAEIIVHKMDGVLMDAEFEQSFPPDYED
ncbi:hypothetical protein MUK42_35841 [Musa troglodytarum]|uniref:FAS1 domain-containing protein n=1 Tax=Musa troglodytarum TaxID=320322 RepID=A0A9E7HAS0_9LILI|nr:hypothetical protein MUK42_35841 [Musa troglodytarum]